MSPTLPHLGGSVYPDNISTIRLDNSRVWAFVTVNVYLIVTGLIVTFCAYHLFLFAQSLFPDSPPPAPIHPQKQHPYLHATLDGTGVDLESAYMSSYLIESH